MKFKRGYLVVLIISILLLSSLTTILAQTPEPDKDNSVWKSIKSGLNSVTSFIGDKASRIIGIKDFRGNYSYLIGEGEFVFGSFIVVLVGITMLTIFIFMIRNRSWKTGLIIGSILGTIIYLFGSGVLNIWYFKIWYFKGTGLEYGIGFEYFSFWILVIIWIFIFSLIYSYSKNDLKGYSKKDIKGEISKIKYYIFLLIIPLLMGIPIINRILQIITLEFLGIHWFWRSLIFSGIIYGFPRFFQDYVKHRERRLKYKHKLEKIAGEEISRAIAKA